MFVLVVVLGNGIARDDVLIRRSYDDVTCSCTVLANNSFLKNVATVILYLHLVVLYCVVLLSKARWVFYG